MNDCIPRLTRRRFTDRIVWYEIASIGLLLVFLWLEECLDLPFFLFKSPITPVNWTELVMETVVIGSLGTYLCFRTRRLIQQIKYLEGFLPVCLFCKKIRMEETWIPLKEYLTRHSEAVFSHGLCPECAREHYGFVSDEHDHQPNPSEG